MKQCFKCKILKPLAEFWVCKQRKSGKTTYCINCCKAIAKLSREKNRVRLNEHNKQYFKTPKGIFAVYKIRAKLKHRDFKLTFKQFYSFWQKPCNYCHIAIKTIGLDRVDNNKGYLMANIVPCCKSCNTGKSNKTYKDFMAFRGYKIL